MDTGDEERFAQALRGFERSMDSVINDLVRALDTTRNTQTITVNAGGVGIWIAVTCVLVMIAAMFTGGFWVMREFNRLDTELGDRKAENESMRSYLNVIYQELPNLKPKDKEDKK